MSKVGIFFSTATGRIRWKLFPDNPEELLFYPQNAGETMLMMDSDEYDRHQNDLQNFINQLTGKSQDDRYVKVQNGIVTGIAYLCPGCGDSLMNGNYVKNAMAKIGDHI